MKWRLASLHWGLGIGVTPVLRLLVYLWLVECGQKRAYRWSSNRMMGRTRGCCLSAKLPSVGKQSSAARA